MIAQPGRGRERAVSVVIEAAMGASIVRRAGARTSGTPPDIDPRTLRRRGCRGLRSAVHATSARPRSGALLEREHELERVADVLGAGARHDGGALVIEGAAGMGKSRLLDEVCEAASKLGLSVFRARATELEQGFPFGVVRQLFERPLLEADSAQRKRWLAGAAARAAEVLRPLADASSRAPPAEPSDPDTAYAWQHGLYWLASNIAADTPLALVVDDLQWCDSLFRGGACVHRAPPRRAGPRDDPRHAPARSRADA